MPNQSNNLLSQHFVREAFLPDPTSAPAWKRLIDPDTGIEYVTNGTAWVAMGQSSVITETARAETAEALAVHKAGSATTLWSGTAAAYTALGTYDAGTVYVVTA